MNNRFRKFITNKIWLIAAKLEDFIFELKSGCDFSGVIQKQAIFLENQINATNATSYEAARCRNINRLFKQTRLLGLEFDSFIDFGSGKGKAAIYAYSKHIFKNVIGVEYSHLLNEISIQNSIKSRAEIDFLNCDAATYLLPKADSFIFLFNPFNDTILEKFLLNNRSHFKNFNSVIAYINDVHIEILEKANFKIIFRDSEKKISLHTFRE